MVLSPVSSHETSAFLASQERVGYPRQPAQQLQYGLTFRSFRGFHERLVQSSGFAYHPGCSYRSGSMPLGSRGVSIQAEHVSLPSHDLDMLAA
jgi:hypothetical protein